MSVITFMGSKRVTMCCDPLADITQQYIFTNNFDYFQFLFFLYDYPHYNAVHSSFSVCSLSGNNAIIKLQQMPKICLPRNIAIEMICLEKQIYLRRVTLIMFIMPTLCPKLVN